MATSLDVLNPPKMYRVRPYFEIKKVKLPACMYLMKPVHQLTNSSPSKEGTSSALSYLEKRQEWVLSQIGKLQERVKVLAENLGVGPAEVGILQQQDSIKTTLKDVVISCPTSSPPYALLALYQYISRCVPTACKVHVHSSATNHATEDLRNFFDGLLPTPKPQLKITLIWKSESECALPTLVVSPHNQTPVEGMANIARYLCREYIPILYEETKGGAEIAAQIDSWLDAISTTLLKGGTKEKISVVRRLNSQLGSTNYLVGSDPTLADIVAYTAMCMQPGMKLGGNVKEWLKRVRVAVPGLSAIPCSYLTNNTSL